MSQRWALWNQKMLWPGLQDRQLASYLQMNFLHPGDAEVLGCFWVWASPARHAREFGPQPADDYPSLLDEVYHDHVPCLSLDEFWKGLTQYQSKTQIQALLQSYSSTLNFLEHHHFLSDISVNHRKQMGDSSSMFHIYNDTAPGDENVHRQGGGARGCRGAVRNPKMKRRGA